jgi:hypothetical protein
MLKGSEDSTKENYSTVSIGKDITLEGWSGIFINHENNKAHGILVNMNGTIKAVNDINNSPGAGIYVNGNIKHENNSPIINLTNTTKITSTGNGIYSAGYATYNINGAYIEGIQSALGIKSGIFNIKNATIIGTGDDKTPTSGNNNGINASGTAIQIESNNGYKGNIELNINSGKIESKKSYTIYEYTVNNSDTQVKNINITGGTYISPSNKPVFSVSDSFKSTHQNFISGGIYTTNPEPYLKNNYNIKLTKDNNYEVIHVFKEKEITQTTQNKETKENNNVFKIALIISSIILISSIIFLSRKKIFIIL